MKIRNKKVFYAYSLVIISYIGLFIYCVFAALNAPDTDGVYYEQGPGEITED